jgi:hypothetical protein
MMGQQGEVINPNPDNRSIRLEFVEECNPARKTQLHAE